MEIFTIYQKPSLYGYIYIWCQLERKKENKPKITLRCVAVCALHNLVVYIILYRAYLTSRKGRGLMRWARDPRDDDGIYSPSESLSRIDDDLLCAWLLVVYYTIYNIRHVHAMIYLYTSSYTYVCHKGKYEYLLRGARCTAPRGFSAVVSLSRTHTLTV